MKLDVNNLASTVCRLKECECEWECISRLTEKEYDFHKLTQDSTVQKFRTIYRNTGIIFSADSGRFALDIIFTDEGGYVYGIPEKNLNVDFVRKRLEELYEVLLSKENNRIIPKLNKLLDVYSN